MSSLYENFDLCYILGKNATSHIIASKASQFTEFIQFFLDPLKLANVRIFLSSFINHCMPFEVQDSQSHLLLTSF